MWCVAIGHQRSWNNLRKPDADSVVFDLNPDAKVHVHRALPFSSWDWLCGQSGA
jgi:DNA primase